MHIILLIGQQIYPEVSISVCIHIILVQLMFVLVLIINEDKLFHGLLHINMGCNSNFYFLDNKITNTNIVGFLKWFSFGDNLGNGYLYSDNNNNSPFFFNNGMFNNFINIRITEFDSVTLWTDSNNDSPNDYILFLTFELME